MKRKIYVRISILFFILSIATFLYTLSLTGLFTKNKILVRALACESCADYQVIIGGFKLSDQIPDTLKKRNISQVFLTGNVNPDYADFTKTYDYYIITGTVTGFRKATVTGSWFPVITVTAWEHIHLSAGWPLILLIIVLLVISLRFHRKFINANKISVLETSIRAHVDIPD